MSGIGTIRDVDTREKAKAVHAEIMANREEVIRAFIAKHGVEPDEVIQEYGKISTQKWTWRLRKMTDAELQAAQRQQVQRDLDALKVAPDPHVFTSKVARFFQWTPPRVYLSELGARTAAGKDGIVSKVEVRA